MNYSFERDCNMQNIRRFKDVLAFEIAPDSFFAFNANTIETAEVSNEIWNEMLPYTLTDSYIPSILKSNNSEVYSELESWNSSINETSIEKKKSDGKIRGITININQICNLKCTYCYADGGTFGDPVKSISLEKTIPQLKYFLEKLPNGSSFGIKFIGGEPLLNIDGIMAVAEYVAAFKKEKDIHCNFSLVTNGTQINEKTLKALILLKATITVSCDGPPHIHDLFRATKSGTGSSKELIEGLKKLFEKKDKLGPISVNGVFGKHNMNLVEAYKFYSTYPFESYTFSVEFNENDKEFDGIFKAQYSKILKMAYEKGGETELRKISEVNHYFTQMDEQSKVIHHCGAGASSVSLDAKNRVFACPMLVSESKTEILFDENFESSLDEKYKKNLIEKNNCGNCWARFMCGGGCMYVNHNINGDMYKKSSAFCERIRFIIIQTLGYYSKIRSEQNTNKGETHETH